MRNMLGRIEKMSLRINIHSKRKKAPKGVIISFKQHYEHIDLFLHKLTCSHCKKDTTYPERIVHALEHEIVEVLCNLIRYKQGEHFPICGCGFDVMAYKWHKKLNTHTCKDGSTWKMLTP